MKTPSTPVTLTFLLLASAGTLAAPIGQVGQSNQPAVQHRQPRGTDGGAVVFGRSQDDQLPSRLAQYDSSLFFGGDVDSGPRDNKRKPNRLALDSVGEDALGEKKAAKGTDSEMSNLKGGDEGRSQDGISKLKKEGTTIEGLDDEEGPQKQDAQEKTKDGKEEPTAGGEGIKKEGADGAKKEGLEKEETRKPGAQKEEDEQESPKKENTEQEQGKREGTEKPKTDKETNKGAEVGTQESANTGKAGKEESKKEAVDEESKKEGADEKNEKEDGEDENKKEKGSKKKACQGECKGKLDDDQSTTKNNKEADDDESAKGEEASKEKPEKKTSSKSTANEPDDAKPAGDDDDTNKKGDAPAKHSKSTVEGDESAQKAGKEADSTKSEETLNKRSEPLHTRSNEFQRGNGRSDPGQPGPLLPPGTGEQGPGGSGSSLGARGMAPMGEIRGAVGRAQQGLHPHPRK